MEGHIACPESSIFNHQRIEGQATVQYSGICILIECKVSDDCTNPGKGVILFDWIDPFSLWVYPVEVCEICRHVGLSIAQQSVVGLRCIGNQ